MAAGTGPYWGVVIPRGGVNVVTNPSFETGTVGWAGTSTVGVTLGTVSERQAFGAWSLQASGGGVLGATTTASLGSGSAYTASAYVRLLGGAGSVQISLGGTSNRVPITGTGWRRISVGTVTPSAASYTLAVMRYDAADALYIDGVQLEAGSVTTYIDGDQEGCYWEATPHASRSQRIADQRAGGTLYPLAALGFRPEETPGIGVAPAVNQLQPYAVSDGAAYQRTRYEARPLTIAATFIGTTFQDLHTTRRRAFDAVKAGRAPTPAPARLLYWGGGGTVSIDALYSDGMDGQYDNPVRDIAAVRFVAPDPSWADVTDQGTSLAPYTVFAADTGGILYRDPAGRWGSIGGPAPGIVSALTYGAGTLFAGGTFADVEGTTAPSIGMWTGQAWGTLAGGTLAGGGVWVNALSFRSGTLFVGGDFRTAGGTVARGIARWSGAWGTLTGGTIGGGGTTVNALALGPRGEVYVGGTYATAGGTTTRGIARWDGAWGSVASGTIIDQVRALAVVPSGTLYVGGDFTQAAALIARRIAYAAGGAWGTLPGGTASQYVVALALTPDSMLHATWAGPEARRYRAGFNEALGSLNTDSGAVFGLKLLLPDGSGGMYVGGDGMRLVNGALPLPFSLARWNGYSWLPPDMRDATGTQQQVGPFAAAMSPSGTLFVGGQFTGAGSAASVTTVVNRGMGDSYPTLRIRHTGAGTARVYQFLNTTTGDGLWFDLILVPGETAILDTERASFTSDVQGTIVGAILGGSNLSTWRLAPGTNTVSFFADHAGIRADLYWRARSMSADGGAEPTI
jgi:hypothetical protein